MSDPNPEVWNAHRRMQRLRAQYIGPGIDGTHLAIRVAVKRTLIRCERAHEHGSLYPLPPRNY